MTPFNYYRPRNPVEAVQLAAAEHGAKFLAGGTNLVDLMKLQIETPAALIDLRDTGLERIERSPNGGLTIGALATNTAIASHTFVQRD